MANSMPKAKPWYSPSRLAKTIGEAWWLRLIPIFIVIFVLILPAVFANVWSNAYGLDPEVGTLQDRLVPPAWIKGKVQAIIGGVDLNSVEVYKNGDLVEGAAITRQGTAITNGEPVLGIIEYRSGGDVIKVGRSLLYPGAVEEGVTSKLPTGLVVVKNPVSFDNGGLYVAGEEVQSGVALMGADNGGEVAFTPLGATIQGRQAKDALEVRDAGGNIVEPVVGIATMQDIRVDGTKDEILAQSNNVRQLTPDGSTKYWLGTDKNGRDLLTRMIYGARISLSVSLIAILFAGIVGTTLGLLAGYVGGWVDALIMRLVDIKLVILSILLALVLVPVVGSSLQLLDHFVAVAGPSFQKVVTVIALLFWALYARQVRDKTLSVKSRDFIQRARAAGASHVRIIFMHILPNVLKTLVIVAILQLATAFFVEAFISYIGAGIPRPTPAWSVMMSDGRVLILSNWWISFFPGLAILVAGLSLFFLGEWTRNRLDPKGRRVT